MIRKIFQRPVAPIISLAALLMFGVFGFQSIIYPQRVFAEPRCASLGFSGGTSRAEFKDCEGLTLSDGSELDPDGCYTQVQGNNDLTVALCSGYPFVIDITCRDGTSVPSEPNKSPDEICENHGGAEGTGQTGNASATGVAFTTPVSDFDETNPIIAKVIIPITQGLGALVGVVVVLSIVIAGVQYSAARDNPQMVASAKNRIVMALIALMIFMFSAALLNWLTPGGLFR